MWRSCGDAVEEVSGFPAPWQKQNAKAAILGIMRDAHVELGDYEVAVTTLQAVMGA